MKTFARCIEGALVSLGLLALLALTYTLAEAQTVPTFTNTVSWTAPTTCTDGTPITNCPVSGYIIEKQMGTAWQVVGTVPSSAREFAHHGNARGSHSYRVIANAVLPVLPSDPSNVSTRNIVSPNSPGAVNVAVTVTVSVSP